MDSIREEENGIFRGLGKNHSKNMIQQVLQTTKAKDQSKDAINLN